MLNTLDSLTLFKRVSLLVILSISFSFTQAYSQVRYVSISDGEWGNALTWQGGRVPPTSMNNAVVVISHQVTYCADLTLLGANDTLRVNSGGSLSLVSACSGIVRVRGNLVTYGSFSANELQIRSGGNVYSYGIMTILGDLIVSQSDLDVYGELEVYGNIEANKGNIKVHSASALIVNGDFNLLNGSSARNIESSSCIVVTGNMNISNTSEVGGDGSVVVLNDLNNTNPTNWDSTVSWCAYGAGYNLPTPPNCDSVAACFSALPIQALHFTATYRSEGTVKLHWLTPSHLSSVRSFILQRGNPRDGFFPLAHLQPESVQGAMENSFSFVDPNPNPLHYAYRLAYVNEEGDVQILAEAFAHIPVETEVKVNISPNPFQDNIKVSLQASTVTEVTLSLSDLTGKVLYQASQNVPFGEKQLVLDPGELPQGAYILQVNIPGNQASYFRIIHE